jgi:hypothetical protein
MLISGLKLVAKALPCEPPLQSTMSTYWMVSNRCFCAWAQYMLVTPGSKPEPSTAISPAFSNRSRYAHCHLYSNLATSGGS